MEMAVFGKIDINNLEEFYEGLIKINGSEVEIYMSFESGKIEEEKLVAVSKFINEIERYANKATFEISKNYDIGEDSETRYYLKRFLQLSSEQEIKDVFGFTSVNKNDFMNAVSLTSIGLAPEEDESFAVFDIQLPSEFTDYVLAVAFDSTGELSYISMES